MTRQTSIDAYIEITNNGLLSKSRMEVYKALYKIGVPSTTREIYATMKVAKMEATRLTELKNLEVIYEHGKRKCQITGREAIIWWVTNGLPIEPKEVKSCRPNNFIKVVKYMIDSMEKSNKPTVTLNELKLIITRSKNNK